MFEIESGPQAALSLSGRERDRLFVNHDSGRGFEDASALSGLDSLADGRAAATFDFDHDGWLDIAVVSANEPLLQLYRNRLGSTYPHRRSITIRFVGGNHTARPNGLSTRDGIGARVSLQLGDRMLVREVRAGEGLAAQHSASMVVGLGVRDRVDTLSVRWPSGRVRRIRDVRAGSLVTAYEVPVEAAPQGFAVVQRESAGPTPAAQRQPQLSAAPGGPRLRLYTTFATWCEACKRALPQLLHLSEQFSRSELGIMGVPVDPNESAAAIERFHAEYAPPYDVLPLEEAALIRGVVSSHLPRQQTPSALLVDRDGVVRDAFFGTPQVSVVRRALERDEARVR